MRAKRIAIAAGGLLATAAVGAPAANATDFLVDSDADNGDGNCQDIPAANADGICTLRDAVDAASSNNNSPASTPDRILFADGVRGTIQLTGSQALEISNDSLEIVGPGADKLTVAGAPSARIFKLMGFDTGSEVKMSGLTLTGGDSGTAGGGAIENTQTCTTPAALTLAGMYIHHNATAGPGGAVQVDSYFCPIGDAKAAGAPSTDPSALNVINSTISENVSEDVGGGISMDPQSGSLFVSNSTIAGNTAGDVGGGISMPAPETVPVPARSSGKATTGPAFSVDNSTISGNQGVAAGGGIYTELDLGLRSTIVHGNEVEPGGSKAPVSSDVSTISPAVTSAGYSLVGTGDVTGVSGETNATGDPQLGALQNNGGTTPTLLPATTSPVIDAGIANSLTTDQRGLPRTADRPPANAADATDIGAVEIPADPPPPPEEPVVEEPTVPAPTTEDCAGKQVILTKGDALDNVLTGTGVDDGILGAPGNDTIDGLSGDDCLYGQVGDDLVVGGPGNDNANGDRDDDTVKGDDGSDSVRGQNGNDKVNGGAGDDPKVTGGAGDDNVKGGSGNDFLKGDGGNDVLDLGSGKDFVHSGGGADEIFAADGEKDNIICGTGKDVAHVDPEDKVDKDCNTVDAVG